MTRQIFIALTIGTFIGYIYNRQGDKQEVDLRLWMSSLQLGQPDLVHRWYM